MNRKHSDDQARQWYEVYKDPTISVAKICAMFNIKADTMVKHFKRLNLEVRPSGFRVGNARGWQGQDPIRLAYLWFFNHAYKRRAKRKGLDVTITDDQFISLVTSDCFHCGRSWQSETRLVRDRHIYMLTIDRLDSSIGYILENCVPSCKVCNTIKMNLDYKLWIYHIRRILEKHDKNQSLGLT